MTRLMVCEYKLSFGNSRARNEVFLPILTTIAMNPKKCIKREGLLFPHSMHYLE
jgi:hypothetical protein